MAGLFLFSGGILCVYIILCCCFFYLALLFLAFKRQSEQYGMEIE